jgi:phosphatidylserine decarboxylase
VSEPNGLSQALALFSPIHKDGYKFVAGAAAAAVVAFLVSTTLGLLFVALTAALIFFFRDPERMVPGRDGLVLAPADGTIISVGTVTPPGELGLGSDPKTRVSIFLNVLDVHVIRTPVAGSIEASVYRPGQFLNAASPQAPALNEYQGFVIETKDATRVGAVLVAGTVARRIVPEVGQGDTVTAGQRVGLIRFGSRVDIYLPPSASVLAGEGQRTIAGESVIADLDSQEPRRIFRRI